MLYCSAFRRLSGVTQVVVPGGEPHLFHNRLLHSIKVAQVGRRLAEKFAGELSERRRSVLLGGGPDPDVVEAACLAHDLGHPPFGHIAEDALNRSVTAAGDPDGFEGNAQSFRIIARLAAMSRDRPGLDLTRATLAATLKYPWFRNEAPSPKAQEKWGAYRDDNEAFLFATDGVPPKQKTIEAEIMDRADDITYAVHDLEDFYRAGLIPLDRIVTGVEDLSPVYERVLNKWPEHIDPEKPSERTLNAAKKFLAALPNDTPFRGTRWERSALRGFTSAMVDYLISSVSIRSGQLRVGRGALVLTELAKQLTWHYVISGAPLATQQIGQRRIVRTLFRTYLRAMRSQDVDVLPTRWREEAEVACQGDPKRIPRFVADVIAGMTEEEAIRVFHRLTGVAPGRLLDPVVL